MTSSKKLAAAIEIVRNYIKKDLPATVAEQPSSKYDDFNRLDHRGLGKFPPLDDYPLGTLHLNQEQIVKFKDLVPYVHDALEYSSLISEDTVERHIATAILKVVHPHNAPSGNNFSKRCTIALEELKSTLTSRPPLWEVLVEVKGIDRELCPLSLGKISIFIPDQEYIAQLQAKSEHSIIQAHAKEHFIKQIVQVEDKVYALVKTRAFDAASARIISINQVRTVIDVVNAFADMMNMYRGRHGYMYLPGEACTESSFLPAICYSEAESNTVEAWNFLTYRNGPLSDFKKEDAGYEEALDKGFDEALILLEKDVLSTSEKTLISALSWIGRANVYSSSASFYDRQVDGRREESFLLLTIALESLLIRKKVEKGLTSLIAHRFAIVMGCNDTHYEEQLRDQINFLYDIRSRIVHSGSVDVSSTNLQFLKHHVFGVAAAFLKRPELRILRDNAAIEEWFSTQQAERGFMDV